MIEATSCGGVVIYRGKILALYKSYKNRYEGWVLPKGTVEPGETHIETAFEIWHGFHQELYHERMGEDAELSPESPRLFRSCNL